jgi:hypothetical protein
MLAAADEERGKPCGDERAHDRCELDALRSGARDDDDAGARTDASPPTALPQGCHAGDTVRVRRAADDARRRPPRVNPTAAHVVRAAPPVPVFDVVRARDSGASETLQEAARARVTFPASGR